MVCLCKNGYRASKKATRMVDKQGRLVVYARDPENKHGFKGWILANSQEEEEGTTAANDAASGKVEPSGGKEDQQRGSSLSRGRLMGTHAWGSARSLTPEEVELMAFFAYYLEAVL